jgi:hypothetical protein
MATQPGRLSEGTRGGRQMYTFKTGEFAGRTMEHVMLRSAPKLYRKAAWAKEKVHEKPWLRPLLLEFKRLRRLLWRAPVAVACDGGNCKRRASTMSFYLDWVEKNLTYGASFWCSKHGPVKYPDEEEEESPTMPLHFDALRQPGYGDRQSQKAIHLAVLEGLGIDKKPTRITEAIARRYFAKLS